MRAVVATQDLGVDVQRRVGVVVPDLAHDVRWFGSCGEEQ